MNESKYTADEFLRFIRIVNCMSDNRFIEMYKTIFGEYCESYAKEKFNLCTKSFEKWICGIDTENLEKMIEFCLKK